MYIAIINEIEAKCRYIVSFCPWGAIRSLALLLAISPLFDLIHCLYVLSLAMGPVLLSFLVYSQFLFWSFTQGNLFHLHSAFGGRKDNKIQRWELRAGHTEKKKEESKSKKLLGISNIDTEHEASGPIVIVGAPSNIQIIEGIYKLTDSKVNGKPQYKKQCFDRKNSSVYLFWSGTAWVLSNQPNTEKEADYLAYLDSHWNKKDMSKATWYVRMGKKFELSPLMTMNQIMSPEKQKVNEDNEPDTIQTESSIDTDQKEIFGVPRILFPYYVAFMLDAIAVGLVMPLLPFFVMELGADAFQLSMVVSSTYVAQSIGCLVMGRVSDHYGRRFVMLVCLAASTLNYFFLSHAQSLVSVVLARLISASFGGLLPIIQSTVADIADVEHRPKFLGRIMATFGLGFVLGPAISAALPFYSTEQKIFLASTLPALGLVMMILFGQETKKEIAASRSGGNSLGGAGVGMAMGGTKVSNINKQAKSPLLGRNKGKEESGQSSAMLLGVPLEVLLLVINGFSIMYAFATETIYAMFIKDSFGYGERALSTLFAMNGFFIGVFQVFFIKPLISLLGKHATLAFGNLLLALGMIGVALVREQRLHFILFAVHIVGYSIADTALASLITKYSSPANQGRDLALNQAAQSCARVISPLLAGILYEWSKTSAVLPMGALPFLAGALCPTVALAVPSLLYIKSMASKRRSAESLGNSAGNNQSQQGSKKCWADSDDEES